DYALRDRVSGGAEGMHSIKMRATAAWWEPPVGEVLVSALPPGVTLGSPRRGGRVVDCTGLENRRPLAGLVSSNLTRAVRSYCPPAVEANPDHRSRPCAR